MKPRLEPAPYTEKDSDIWIYVGLWGSFTLNDKLELASAICDRRDADLMLIAQQLPWAWHCQVGEGDWHLVRSKQLAKTRDPLWQSQWSQS